MAHSGSGANDGPETPMKPHGARATVRAVWQAGVDAVGGEQAVAAALRTCPAPAPDQIIAVGKAAGAMARAAIDHFQTGCPTLVVTKYGHAADLPDHVTLIEAGHPVPDRNSILGGQALKDTVGAMAPDSHLMVLVSGGASALAELPRDGLDLDDLARANREMLAAGLDIHAMNQRRKTLSQIKGGQLLAGFSGRSVTVLAISDVQGDDIGVIGSGIGAVPQGAPFAADMTVVASNRVARDAAMHKAAALGLPSVENSEILYGDVNDIAAALAPRLIASAKGISVFGGEPTVVLPDPAGQGGRNQALALLLAREIQGIEGLTILVGGTDGTDGPTDAAGAVIDGATWGPGADEALERADSGTWLDRRGALVRTGPTGTNVMDLLVALRA
ncbi:D-glycerate 2-kinase (plasmid) [Pseudoseohaeicola sp. NH-UV-7]|uniref:glycerate kinase type-2 family protein n=1 Tax=unclassified Sulfitobacter TaxID=196795 RepID=UPI0020C81A4F|nr:DUF4147 domain-containing protein [Sulfitobacter sp. JL08]